MARRRKSKDESFIELVAAAVATIAFIAWGVPSFWAALKPFVYFGGILAALIAAFLLYRMLTKSTEAPHQKFLASQPSTGNSSFRPPTRTERAKSYDVHVVSTPSAPIAPSHQHASPVPQTFCEASLRRMDWLGFEHLVVDVFNALGFKATKTSAGADGGVDIELRSMSAEAGSQPKAFVQCKARSLAPIGVDKLRELLGVITAKGVRRGILVTNSEFTDDARAFAKSVESLQIGDIQWLLKKIETLPDDLKQAWQLKHLGPGYDIPSCVACEVKMKPRQGPKGSFWGCPNFGNSAIRCRNTMKVRRLDEVHFTHA